MFWHQGPSNLDERLFLTSQQCKITVRASLLLRSLYAAKAEVNIPMQISLKGFLLCVTCSVKPRQVLTRSYYQLMLFLNLRIVPCGSELISKQFQEPSPWFLSALEVKIYLYKTF